MDITDRYRSKHGHSGGFRSGVTLFFFSFYKSRKGKLHCHDTMSRAIALVKAARPWCRALAFASCWSTSVAFKGVSPTAFRYADSPSARSSPRSCSGLPSATLRWEPGQVHPARHRSFAQRCLPRACCQPPRLPWVTSIRAEGPRLPA